MSPASFKMRILCTAAALAPVWLPIGPVAQAAFSEQGATVLGGANYSARSVSLADIDNDGDLDAFFQGSSSSARQMLRNNIIGTGSFTFTNITSSMLPSGVNGSWSAAWGDYNGDGLVDVFVGQENSGSASGDVLRNNGTSFSNESSATNLDDPGFHQNVGWVDIDNDRDLDLIIGMEGPERHQIYLQDPASQFTPVGAAVGLQADFGTKAYGTAIGDSDGDGDLDIYISTCRSGGNIRNNFYKNMLTETGSLAFVDIADSNGTQFMDNSYGSEFQDFDNDGDLDLYMTGADGSKTKLWRNDGGNMFTDVDTLTGHELLRNESGVPVRGVDLNGSKAVDYDNDGDLDLYFHDNLASTGNQRLFRNEGNWEFVDVTVTEGLHEAAGGAPVGAGGYDSAWGDLDRDGDQDLIDPNNSTFGGITPTPERVYVSNESTNGNHWLYVRLAGPADNTTGIGASLYATVNGGTPAELTLRREANTNIGTFNQSDLPVHFGLAAATEIDKLQIRWPDGSSQTLYNVTADQYLTVQYSPGLQGDFDGNGVVDAGDYIVWRKGLGATYNGAARDDWLANFGQSLLGSSAGDYATAPEPEIVVLVTIGLIGLLLRRRTSGGRARARRPIPHPTTIAARPIADGSGVF